MEEELTAAAPTVAVLDLGVNWRAGAEGPVVVSGPFYAAIAFLTSPDNDDDVALVTFELCASIRTGSPNDEALSGHPLYEHGLTLYAAHEVTNSPLLHELVAINRVHPRFASSQWEGLRHFVFTFKEHTVEALAKGYRVEQATDGLAGAAARMGAAATSVY